jgi:hypothetical protein
MSFSDVLVLLLVILLLIWLYLNRELLQQGRYAEAVDATSSFS